jgi:hypothetical protein
VQIIEITELEIERNVEETQINGIFPHLDEFLKAQIPFTKKSTDELQAENFLYQSKYF